MRKAELNRIPASVEEGACGDRQVKELEKSALIGKMMMPLLILVLCLALLAVTFAWFKEINSAESEPVTLSSRYITMIYFEDFERDQLDIDNRFKGQTGLGTEGTETASDAPYEAKFLLSVRVDENTPVPVKINMNIRSVSVKKAAEDAALLSPQQINDNFRVKLYNPSTLTEGNIAETRDADFILIIRYWGETEGVPFAFSGIDYNGAEFTFALEMYGEVA